MFLWNRLVVSNIFYFHPYLGKSSNLTNIFQVGWNHQIEKSQTCFGWMLTAWLLIGNGISCKERKDLKILVKVKHQVYSIRHICKDFMYAYLFYLCVVQQVSLTSKAILPLCLVSFSELQLGEISLHLTQRFSKLRPSNSVEWRQIIYALTLRGLSQLISVVNNYGYLTMSQQTCNEP